MDTSQVLLLAWGAVTSLAGIIYKMQLDRIKKLEARNEELEDELKANNQQLAKNTEALHKVMTVVEKRSEA